MTNASAMAAQLIRYYESCSLKPYLDAKGVATIGWGNTTYANGAAVKINDQLLTQLEADALFEFWLDDFARGIVPYVPGASDNQCAAFISLAYNIGLSNFDHSTALREYLRANYVAAGAAFELWDRAGNHVLKGLQRRRRAEHLVFDGETVALALVQAAQAFP